MRKLNHALQFSPPKNIGRFLSLVIAGTALQACVSSGGGYQSPTGVRPPHVIAQQSPNDLSIPDVDSQRLSNQQHPAGIDNLAPVKVAILLPLSGNHAKLGVSMLNAAQMAVFDIGHSNFELIPRDTKGTAKGARTAAKAAINDGAKLVLGPVFSHSVKAASQVTQASNINMVAFSTDWTLANNKTFLIGFLPFDQVDRIVSYAAKSGYYNIGVLSPTGNYGRGVVSAYEIAAQNLGINSNQVQRFTTGRKNMNLSIRKFSQYDQRKNSTSGDNIAPPPYDAVLMPVGGAMARQVGSFLNHYDMPPRTVKRLGTGLMDDKTLAHDKTLDGAWFAAPPPQARMRFERRYYSTFYSKPIRLASLAYDATALATILARTGLKNSNRPAFDNSSITNPNGFAGIDGIFRFRHDGIVERGLAVLEYRKGKIVVIDKAPKTFQNNRI